MNLNTEGSASVLGRNNFLTKNFKMNISDVNQDGIGLDGIDPVAHYNGEFLRGDKTISTTINDVTYLFSSEENLEKFQKDPAKYIPIAGSFGTGNMRGNINDANNTQNYVGNEFLNSNRGLEDTELDHETTPPPAGTKRSMERENLHDSEN